MMKLDSKIISGNELLTKLKAANWADILPKLHYYALNKFERYPTLEGRFNIENLATTYADEAIRMVYEQERNWNREAYPNLYPFLTGIVDSLINGFMRSPEVRLSDRLPDNDYNLFDPSEGTAESNIIVHEIEAEIKEILSSDTQAYEVFECLKDGLKPREIGPELNIDMNEVRNIIKRVHRKLKDYKVKLKAG